MRHMKVAGAIAVAAALALFGTSGTAQAADPIQWTHAGYTCETASWKSASGYGRDGRVTLRSTKDKTKFARLTMTNTSKGQTFRAWNGTELIILEYWGRFTKNGNFYYKEYRRKAAEGQSHTDLATIPRGYQTQLEVTSKVPVIGSCMFHTAST